MNFIRMEMSLSDEKFLFSIDKQVENGESRYSNWQDRSDILLI